jgi:GNAT superfamily N-acetyltransferase
VSDFNIREALQEANKGAFSPESVRIELLKDYQQFIPRVAEWIYEEWVNYDAFLTKEKIIEGFKKRLNDHEVPFTLIALKNSIPIGVISLKKKNENEFVEFNDPSPWLGSFHVVVEERNKGLGQKLFALVKKLATSLGYQKIFLYNSNPLSVSWYQKRGAHLMEMLPFHGHTITLMMISNLLEI